MQPVANKMDKRSYSPSNSSPDSKGDGYSSFGQQRPLVYGRDNKSGFTKTPYARPKNVPNESLSVSGGATLLSKVKNTFKNLLIPSWLGSSSNNQDAKPVAVVSSIDQKVASLDSPNHVQGKYTLTTPTTTQERQPQNPYAPRAQRVSVNDPPQYLVPEHRSAPLPVAHPVMVSRYDQRTEHGPVNCTLASGQLKRLSATEHMEDAAIIESNSRSLRKKYYLDGSISESVNMDCMDENPVVKKSFNESSVNISSFARSYNESMDGSTICGGKLSNSSFYAGKTVFGGRSSKRSLNLPAPTPFKRRCKMSNSTGNDVESNFTGTATKAAMLILKALEKTGTESEAPGDDRILLNSAVYLKKSSTLSSNILPPNTPPISSFTRSSPSTKIPSKNSSDAIPYGMTTTSFSSIHVQSKDMPHVSAKFGGKIKKDRPHYSSLKLDDNKNDHLSELSASFALPVPATFKIDFGSSTVAHKNIDCFTFRPPKCIKVARSIKPLSTNSDSFRFSKPIELKEKNVGGGNTPAAMTVSSVNTGWGNLLKSQANQWKCSTCCLRNENSAAKCVACGAAKTKSASINSSAPAAAPSTSTGWGDMFKNQASQWKCSTCSIRNESSAAKCIACGSANAEATSASTAAPTTITTTTPLTSTGWGDLFKNQASQWKCSTCSIRNDSSAAKCVACGSANAEATSTSTAAPTTITTTTPLTSTGWGDLFKNQASQWKCSTCSIRNKSSAAKCIACGSANAEATSTSTAAPTTITTTTPLTSTGWGDLFKNQASQWKCSTCSIRNESSAAKCIACGSANAEATSTSAAAPTTTTTTTTTPLTSTGWGDLFKNQASQWKCSTCSIRNESSAAKCVACGSANTNTSSITTSSSTSAPLSSAGWGDLFKSQASQWKCSTCSIRNESSTAKCIACGTANTDATSTSTAAPTTTPLTSAGWGDLFKNQANQWKCSACSVLNEFSVANCLACGAKHSNASVSTLAVIQSEPKKADSFSVGQKPLELWYCPVSSCGVVNGIDRAMCQVCGVRNPDADERPPIDPDWWKGRWKCHMCYTMNDSTISFCLSCNSCKPGTMISLGPKGHTSLPVYEYTANDIVVPGGKLEALLFPGGLPGAALTSNFSTTPQSSSVLQTQQGAQSSAIVSSAKATIPHSTNSFGSTSLSSMPGLPFSAAASNSTEANIVNSPLSTTTAAPAVTAVPGFGFSFQKPVNQQVADPSFVLAPQAISQHALQSATTAQSQSESKVSFGLVPSNPLPIASAPTTTPTLSFTALPQKDSATNVKTIQFKLPSNTGPFSNTSSASNQSFVNNSNQNALNTGSIFGSASQFSFGAEGASQFATSATQQTGNNHALMSSKQSGADGTPRAEKRSNHDDEGVCSKKALFSSGLSQPSVGNASGFGSGSSSGVSMPTENRTESLTPAVPSTGPNNGRTIKRAVRRLKTNQ